MLLLLLSPFILLGLADCYMAYRFIRKPEVDNTAGFLNYWMLKWLLASQTKLIAQKLPFISRDLSETLGIREDDRIT